MVDLQSWICVVLHKDMKIKIRQSYLLTEKDRRQHLYPHPNITAAVKGKTAFYCQWVARGLISNLSAVVLRMKIRYPFYRLTPDITGHQMFDRCVRLAQNSLASQMGEVWQAYLGQRFPTTSIWHSCRNIMFCVALLQLLLDSKVPLL